MTNLRKTSNRRRSMSGAKQTNRCTYSDPVGQYLDQINEFAILSADEETTIARQLQGVRRRLRRVVLRNHYMLTGVAEALRQVHQGQSRADWVLDCTRFDREAYLAFTARLPQLVWRLQRLVARNWLDAARLCEFTNDRFAWRPYARRLKTRCREAAIIGWQAKPRMKTIYPCWRRLAAISTRMLWLERSLLTQSGQQAELRKELSRLITLTGTRPRALARWINVTTVLMVRYDALKHRLARHNLRLVVSIAKRYGQRGAAVLDLIQEGNAGLMEAADRFEPRGFRFTTYATWWIKKSIWDWLTTRDRLIALPRDKASSLRRLHRTRSTWPEQHGRNATVDEELEASGCAQQDAEPLLRLSLPVLSLDLADHENEGTLGELIEDPRRDDPSRKIDRQSLSQFIEELLIGLNQRERQVIELRFGLNGQEPSTLEKAGKLLGVSRERVRQIERRAVEKLRSSRHRARLETFFDS